MEKCKYPDCESPAKTAGFCSSHYAAKQRAQVSLIKARQSCAQREDFKTWHCVYIIGCREFDPVKIGRSSSALNRLSTMQTGCPYRLMLFDAFFAPKDVIVWLEWDVRLKLCEFGLQTRTDSLRSEWFDVSPNDGSAVVQKCAEKHNFVLTKAEEYFTIAKREEGFCNPEWLKSVEQIVREVS